MTRIRRTGVEFGHGPVLVHGDHAFRKLRRAWNSRVRTVAAGHAEQRVGRLLVQSLQVEQDEDGALFGREPRQHVSEVGG